MNERGSAPKKNSSILRFISYYRTHLPLFSLDMLCALVISGVDIIYPLITRKALNEYVVPGKLPCTNL